MQGRYEQAGELNQGRPVDVQQPEADPSVVLEGYNGTD